VGTAHLDIVASEAKGVVATVVWDGLHWEIRVVGLVTSSGTVRRPRCR
jgi:hypothetical protein